MNKQNTYRRRALECAQAAGRASDLQACIALLELAVAWAKLAEHAHDSPDEGGPGSDDPDSGADTKH